MTPHEFAQQRLAVFWETVKERGLSTMAEFYRQEVEKLVKERDDFEEKWLATCTSQVDAQLAPSGWDAFHNAERIADQLRTELNNTRKERNVAQEALRTESAISRHWERMAAADRDDALSWRKQLASEGLKAQLAQRRDMTLTPELWTVLQRLKHNIEYPRREDDVRLLCDTLERWSREGATAALSICAVCDKDSEHCRCDDPPKPSAPDLAALQSMRHELAIVLLGWKNNVQDVTHVVDTMVKLFDAIIKAAREVNND